MVKSSQPVIKITEFGHVSAVVHDIDKSANSMWNIFGIGPWNVFTMAASAMSDMTYHGKPARFGFKAAILQNNLGGMGMELIEPLEGDSIYRDFLREHGDGIHHLGSYLVDNLEVFEETTRRLEKAGFACLMRARTHGSAFAYFDTSKVLNTILEMLWIESFPQPDYVLPK
jgi:methylmalonyl-CoA/ethylmalonyl-CoA epimerase